MAGDAEAVGDGVDVGGWFRGGPADAEMDLDRPALPAQEVEKQQRAQQTFAVTPEDAVLQQ